MTTFSELPVNTRITEIERVLVQHMAGFGFDTDFCEGNWLARPFYPEATLDLTELARELERMLT